MDKAHTCYKVFQQLHSRTHTKNYAKIQPVLYKIKDDVGEV